jgi:hypothetical protein
VKRYPVAAPIDIALATTAICSKLEGIPAGLPDDAAAVYAALDQVIASALAERLAGRILY